MVLKSNNNLPLIPAPFTMEDMVCTDPDRNQYGKKLYDGHYQFMEFDADAGEWVEMDILLKLYTDVEISNHISAYYTSIVEIEKIYGEDAEWIIAECIFEQESGLY
jgi:hypothetical protein